MIRSPRNQTSAVIVPHQGGEIKSLTVKDPRAEKDAERLRSGEPAPKADSQYFKRWHDTPAPGRIRTNQMKQSTSGNSAVTIAAGRTMRSRRHHHHRSPRPPELHRRVEPEYH
jgi:hypothetical protein